MKKCFILSLLFITGQAFAINPESVVGQNFIDPWKKDLTSLCIIEKDFSLKNIQEFIQSKIPEEYTFKITDVISIFEISESPKILGTELYIKYKNSTICETTFSGIIKNNNTQQEITMEINTMYQLINPVFPTTSIYIRMSPKDIETASEIVKEKIKEQMTDDTTSD